MATSSSTEKNPSRVAAGVKAAATRKRRAAAAKAAETKRRKAISERQRQAAYKAWATRRLNAEKGQQAV